MTRVSSPCPRLEERGSISGPLSFDRLSIFSDFRLVSLSFEERAGVR
jgi:hypothetical protein